MSMQFNFTCEELVREEYVTRDQIEDIKIWLDKKNIPKLRDEQIVYFLMSCCNNLQATKKTIEAYFDIRTQHGELFNNWRLSREDLHKVANFMMLAVPTVRTPDNHAFFFSNDKYLTYSDFDLHAVITLGMMTLDATVYRKPASGLVAIIDMQGTSLWHLAKINIKVIKPFFRYVQEALPIRLEVVHVINTPRFINSIMIIIKPFMKTELLKKIHFHPTNMDWNDFYSNCVPREYLPEDYGGLLPPMSTLHEENNLQLSRMENNFAVEELVRRNI